MRRIALLAASLLLMATATAQERPLLSRAALDSLMNTPLSAHSGGVIKASTRHIELGEIEVIANMREGVKTACCIFDNVKKKIILFYVGDVTPAEMTAYIKEKLPRYMVPNVVRQLDEMPFTPNGKIDRNGLKTMYENK